MATALEQPWGKLTRFEPRHFVPDGANFQNKEEVVAQYERLLAKDIRTENDLDAWLRDRSELEAVLDETGSVLYVKMTCQTDDSSTAQAYQRFIEDVLPAVK